MPRLACLLLAAAAALFAGCGGGEGGDGEAEIRAMIEVSSRSEDPAGCRRYSTQNMLEQSTGLKGEAAVRACEEGTQESDAQPGAVSVTRIEVNGDRATAWISIEGHVYDGQTVAYALAEEDGSWKMDEALEFVHFDRDRLLLEWGRESFRDVRTQADADLVACAIKRVEQFDDAALEMLFLAPDLQLLQGLARACESHSASI